MTTPPAKVIYGWERQSGDPKVCLSRAGGCYFWDDQGNRYLDFCSSQFNVNLGHRHPRVVSAMKRQLDSLIFVAPSFATEVRTELADQISQRAPAGLNSVFFTNSGSESIENAIKVARAVTGRNKIYSAWQSYHGATLGASAASGDKRRLFAEPSLPAMGKFNAACCFRCPFGQEGPPECQFACTSALLNQILHEGPDTIAAIIIEPVAGTSGVYIWPDEYLKRLQQLCREFGILLIVDETITAWGRTGSWFASEGYGLKPDILTTAKGITSGYAPLGAVIMNDAVRDHFVDREFVGGLTNEGHALSCATALECLRTYEEEQLIAGSTDLGEHLFKKLKGLQATHECIADVRGKGMLACIEIGPLNSNLPAFFDDRPISAFLSRELMRKGIFCIVKWGIVFVAPPLTIKTSQIDEAIGVIDEVLSSLSAKFKL